MSEKVDFREDLLLDNREKEKIDNASINFMLIVIVFLFALLTVKTFFVSPVLVSGTSMENTIHPQDLLLTYKSDSVKQNDIVCINVTNNGKVSKILIKRVIAVAGQTVDIKEGNVYVDGVEVEEPETCRTVNTDRKNQIEFPLKLKENEFFVLGDNREVSQDSRYYGAFENSDIFGIVPVWAIKYKEILKFFI